MATGRTAGWTIGMLAVTQLVGLLQTMVANQASGAGPSTGALGYAWLIFMLPHSLITVSLLTVYYPRLSAAAAIGDDHALRRNLGSTIRTVLPLIALADVLLLVTAEPIARLLTHGPGDAQALAVVIVGYLIALVPFTILAIVQRCFYALGDTRTPFAYTLVQVVLVTAGFLGCLQLPLKWHALGIALVTTTAGAVQSVVAWRLLRRHMRHALLGLASTARSTAVAGAAALLLGSAALVGANTLLGADDITATWLSATAAAVTLGTVTVAVYLLGLRLTGSAALQQASARLRALIARDV